MHLVLVWFRLLPRFGLGSGCRSDCFGCLVSLPSRFGKFGAEDVLTPNSQEMGVPPHS
jgi:hypothetical protein